MVYTEFLNQQPSYLSGYLYFVEKRYMYRMSRSKFDEHHQENLFPKRQCSMQYQLSEVIF